jgi:hypothetical protein
MQKVPLYYSSEEGDFPRKWSKFLRIGMAK